jgi:rare lipoprotein A
MDQMTAAHRTLPVGTLVEVHNLDNGRRALVRINDRGPFVKGRILDLSRAAARQLGVIGPGTARVELRVTRLAAADAGRHFVVQVGAFRERPRADAVTAELRRRGFDATIEPHAGYFRVRLGPLDERGAAEALRDELTAAGYPAVLLALPDA